MTGRDTPNTAADLSRNQTERASRLTPESMQDEITYLEEELQRVKQTSPLPNEFVQSPRVRRETITNMNEEQLAQTAHAAITRVLAETDFFSVFAQLGIPLDIQNDRLNIPNRQVLVTFNNRGLIRNGYEAHFSINRSGKPEIQLTSEQPTVTDIFTYFLLPYYSGNFPPVLSPLAHEATHLKHFLIERERSKQKKFDNKVASPVMEGRPLAEAIAWRVGTEPFSASPDESSTKPLWHQVKQNYGKQVNASDAEWEQAFQSVDNLFALGYSVEDIIQFHTQNSRFQEQTRRFEALEQVIDSRLTELGLTRDNLPSLRRRFSLQKQLSSQNAARICREEFLGLIRSKKN